MNGWKAVLVCMLFSEAAAREWELHLLSTEGGAVCLDGSPGGYYISRGSSKDWVVFHEGGGWCWSTGVCFSRAQSALGSSKTWPLNATSMGEIGTAFDVFPFQDHNVVYAKYCDGGSWTGNSSEVYNNTNPAAGPLGNYTLNYRGRLLLDALLKELEMLGLGAPSSRLLYGGCSAGGLTSATHADYVAGRFPQAHVLGLTDAMFSVDRPNAQGEISYLQNMMNFGFTAWNSAKSINQQCLQHYVDLAGGNISAGVHCMFGANLAPFVQTPMFYMQSRYDTWQEKAILMIDCDVTKCTNASEAAAWTQLGDSILHGMQNMPARHGAWLTNCPGHCQTDPLGRRVNNVSGHDALAEWYLANGSLPAARHLPNCSSTPCSGTDICTPHQHLKT